MATRGRMVHLLVLRGEGKRERPGSLIIRHALVLLREFRLPVHNTDIVRMIHRVLLYSLESNGHVESELLTDYLDRLSSAQYCICLSLTKFLFFGALTTHNFLFYTVTCCHTALKLKP